MSVLAKYLALYRDFLLENCIQILYLILFIPLYIKLPLVCSQLMVEFKCIPDLPK